MSAASGPGDPGSYGHPGGPAASAVAEFPADQLVVMAIVNRTPDSFYRPGVTWDPAAAPGSECTRRCSRRRRHRPMSGGRAGPPRATRLTAKEEIRRTIPFIGGRPGTRTRS